MVEYHPYYARDKQYIKENVKDPFNYIVLDYKSVDAELMKEGIDNKPPRFIGMRRMTTGWCSIILRSKTPGG